MSADRAIWDPEWEASPPEALASAIEQRLREQLAWMLRRSGFYREKLAGVHVDLEHIRLPELAELPFTFKDEIRRSQQEHPPLGAHACVDWSEISRVHASSGTTGTPTLVGATARDRETWNELIGRCLWASGARPGERAWVAATLGWWIAGLTFVDALQHIGAVVLPAGHTEVARTFRVLERTGVDYVISTPSFLRHLARVARDDLGLDPRSLGISALGVGGEPGGGLPHVRRELEETWGGRVHDTMGTADFSTLMWAECDAGDGMHFLGEGLVIAELLDPRDGLPMPAGEGAVGELAYTAIRRECTPLLRFRVGDVVQVVGMGRCRCGRTTPRIRCVGRADDMLICQGVNVYPSAVADVVAGLRPRTTGRIEIEVRGDGPAVEPPVPVRVEYEGSPDLPALRAEVEDRLRRELVFRAHVQLVEKGALQREDGMKDTLLRRIREVPS